MWRNEFDISHDYKYIINVWFGWKQFQEFYNNNWQAASKQAGKCMASGR